METASKRLQRAFIDDHRTLLRGYTQLIQTLETRDFVRVAEEACRLDRLAGPHIAFEERFLYPKVRESRGESYASKLYNDHVVILETLIELQNLESDSELTNADLTVLTQRLRRGLDHAVACGSLLSQLQTLSDSEQAKALEQLDQLRAQAIPWSELKTSNSG